MSQKDHVSGRQIAAARALLGITQPDLAGRSMVSVPTLKRMEGSDGAAVGMANNVLAVRRALESAGVIFVAENGDGLGVRLRKGREDRQNLDAHIEHIEREVADLKPAASAEPRPATGMAMLRKARAKNDLTKARNKRREGERK